MWLPAIAHPSRRDHPVSLNCRGTRENAVLVIQTRCRVLSATQTSLQRSFSVVLSEGYMYLSPPTPQKVCFQQVMLCCLVVPLPLHIAEFLWQNGFPGKLEYHQTSDWKGKYGRKMRCEIHSQFGVELSNQNAVRKWRMLKSSASIRLSCFSAGRAAWETRSVYSAFMA